MSMIVARMQKMKSENLVGIGNHNQRKTSRHSNPDIDVERSYLNYDLVNRTENYKTDIEHYINTHKTTKKAVRTDAVLVNEWIITSDTAFFSSLSEAEQRRFFQSATNFFAERYGDENIRYATVHLDERTPHMHLGIVPFTVDYKLSAKTLFDRTALKAIQEELPSYLREQGFDIVRGKENSQAKHLNTPEFKEKVRHLEILDKEIQRNQTRLFQQMALEDNVKTLLHDPISEVPHTSYTKVPLNKVLVDKDDFEQLQSAAHRFKSLCRQQRAQLFNQTKDIERLQNKIHYMEREEQQKENERQVRFDYQKSLLEREMKEKRIELDDIRRNLKQREEKIEKRMLGLGYLEGLIGLGEGLIQGMGGWLDVDHEFLIRLDKGEGRLGIRLIHLGAMGQSHGHKGGGGALGAQFLHGQLGEPTSQGGILASADPQYKALGVGFLGIGLQEIHPSAHLSGQVNRGLYSKCLNDLRLHKASLPIGRHTRLGLWRKAKTNGARREIRAYNRQAVEKSISTGEKWPVIQQIRATSLQLKSTSLQLNLIQEPSRGYVGTQPAIRAPNWCRCCSLINPFMPCSQLDWPCH